MALSSLGTLNTASSLSIKAVKSSRGMEREEESGCLKGTKRHRHKASSTLSAYSCMSTSTHKVSTIKNPTSNGSSARKSFWDNQVEVEDDNLSPPEPEPGIVNEVENYKHIAQQKQTCSLTKTFVM